MSIGFKDAEGYLSDYSFLIDISSEEDEEENDETPSKVPKIDAHQPINADLNIDFVAEGDDDFIKALHKEKYIKTLQKARTTASKVEAYYRLLCDEKGKQRRREIQQKIEILKAHIVVLNFDIKILRAKLFSH